MVNAKEKYCNQPPGELQTHSQLASGFEPLNISVHCNQTDRLNNSHHSSSTAFSNTLCNVEAARLTPALLGSRGPDFLTSDLFHRGATKSRPQRKHPVSSGCPTFCLHEGSSSDGSTAWSLLLLLLALWLSGRRRQVAMTQELGEGGEWEAEGQNMGTSARTCGG